MSGGISGTAYAAAVAVSALGEDFPDRRIAAVDTLGASLGEGLQVLSAAQMIADGMAFDAIYAALSEMRHKMCQYFTVGELRYLQKTGRVSKLLSVVGTVLKIKPLLQGDEEGKIILCGKARGERSPRLPSIMHGWSPTNTPSSASRMRTTRTAQTRFWRCCAKRALTARQSPSVMNP